MKTLHLSSKNIDIAAQILKRGGLVAIPTETVYGLAASAYNIEAIKNIYLAKGRPSDNPLIVHIDSIENIFDVVSEFPENAQKLAQAFWPGPITVILPKNDKIPPEVCAGMDSVAVRMPLHPIAREIIKKSGLPLVAPSANLSGKPSPTSFEHVAEDLDGKIDAIVDGGRCSVGVESTVVSLCGDVPKILRPGAITAQDIQNVLGNVLIDDSVCNKLKPDQKVLSPGVKYKHYAPSTPVVMLKGGVEEYACFVNGKKHENIAALCLDEDIALLEVPYISYGSVNSTGLQEQQIFSALRRVDELNAKTVYAHFCGEVDSNLAVYNRLIRAAAFNITDLSGNKGGK